MFNSVPNLQFSRYLINPDECYSSGGDFEQTNKALEFLSTNSEDAEALSLSEGILLIETPEGVFIRAQDPVWCALLTGMAENPGNKVLSLKIISQADWFNVTTRCRAPLQSRGNEKLARWRVGF